MSEYYTPQRTKNLYNSKSDESFKLSRSKIDLFLECPRCFYLDRRLGVGRPPGFPFALNSAVDKLLKKEFDITLIAYKGDDSWVEKAVIGAHKCLTGNKIPKAGADCDYCAYIKAVESKTLLT